MFESEHAVAYGINATAVLVRGARAPAGPRLRAPRAAGQRQGGGRRGATRPGSANGGRDDGPPGQRPQYGRRYYAAYLRDPDGLRVEVVAREVDAPAGAAGLR